jgi:hypothetical protein
MARLAQDAEVVEVVGAVLRDRNDVVDLHAVA